MAVDGKAKGESTPRRGKPAESQAIKNRVKSPMRQALYRMSGVDLTSIRCIGVETAQLVISEYGPDLSRFPTEKEFIFHLTLAPHRPTAGASR